jgi:putative DNA methylase
VQGYGMTHHADLFTSRQLLVLTTLAALVKTAHDRCLEQGGSPEYADALAVYLSFGVSKCSDYGCSIASWASHPKQEAVRNAFARQAIPMTWDFAEANPLGRAAGSASESFSWVGKVLDNLPANRSASSSQENASDREYKGFIIATDPPYYDNIGYADLSDFFYIWLRRCLRDYQPELLSTMLTPKSGELVADPFRFGGRSDAANRFFENGFREVFRLVPSHHPTDYPLTIFYAFKQSEAREDGQASTGWETMLEGILSAGLSVTGTWPMRTELGNRMRDMGSNALASSIVLVCRPRSETAGVTDRRGFINAMKADLPDALRHLQQGYIAPVDLAQAAIGPGMAVFSRFAKVVEPDGTPMGVRTALTLINQVLDEVLAEQEGEFDGDTRFAIAWFEQHGFDEGRSGDADQLARAKNVGVDGLVRAGIFEAKGGKARLLGRDELAADWDPASDDRVPVWEVAQHLIKRLEDGGESEAAALLGRVGGLGDAARDLAYRLYSVCERKKWARDALAFNSLVTSWPELTRLASAAPGSPVQETML